MKNGQKKLILSTIILILGLTGCLNLKSVNDYSSTSLKSIKKFEDINYSFNQHCIDECQFEAIKTFTIVRKPEEYCKCVLYQEADKVTQLIYNSINGYFEGLSNLSNDKLTTYNFDALTKSLKEGNFGKTGVQITSAQVDGYAKISQILLRATTDLYRKNKIRDYIEQANAPIQTLLDSFKFILKSNLENEINVKKEKLYDYYTEMKIRGTLSEYEQGKAVIEYYQQVSALNGKENQIETFAKGLDKIKEGHQKLYDNRNKMTTKELSEMLIQYSSDIQDIISEFNKLQK